MSFILGSAVEAAGTVSIVGVLVAAFGYSITLLNRGTDRMDKNAEERLEAAEQNAAERIATAVANAAAQIATAERNAAERIAAAEANAEARTRGMAKDLQRALEERNAAMVQTEIWQTRYWELRSNPEDKSHGHPPGE